LVPFDAGSHAPDFVVVRHEPEAGSVLVTMHLTSHQVLTRLLKLDPAWTLEETWDKAKRAWSARDKLGMTPEEAALGGALTKLPLNTSLLATAYGVRRLGPANPSHYERLKRHAQLARKRGREQVNTPPACQPPRPSSGARRCFGKVGLGAEQEAVQTSHQPRNLHHPAHRQQRAVDVGLRPWAGVVSDGQPLVRQPEDRLERQHEAGQTDRMDLRAGNG
jgi:hypothetical protein